MDLNELKTKQDKWSQIKMFDKNLKRIKNLLRRRVILLIYHRKPSDFIHKCVFTRLKRICVSGRTRSYIERNSKPSGF